ncbi:hypothetical protein FHS94_002700 [Sphingomonas aerophila]|uniref:Uncharacterized protein n=2 Tax=Sphingomonas aerophila TaxID=1344948 RepID=A0A7W9BF12_9SPHN|nr:hypothetical protein [Sphingomonas aerophila]
MNAEVLAALAAKGITTAIMGRLDFKSETVCIWTGAEALTVQGSTDSLLNNQTFDPLVHGVVLDIGENNMSMAGSDALKITLGIPSDPSAAITAAIVYPDEYQARPATLWRAIMIQSPIPGAPATWAFRRIRTGRMDTLEVSNDGSTQKFVLGIEGHAGLISNATNSTYMSQKSLDPADTSQDYVLACANGDPAPTKAAGTGLVRAGQIIQQNQGLDRSFR